MATHKQNMPKKSKPFDRIYHLAEQVRNDLQNPEALCNQKSSALTEMLATKYTKIISDIVYDIHDIRTEELTGSIEDFFEKSRDTTISELMEHNRKMKRLSDSCMKDLKMELANHADTKSKLLITKKNESKLQSLNDSLKKDIIRLQRDLAASKKIDCELPKSKPDQHSKNLIEEQKQKIHQLEKSLESERSKFESIHNNQQNQINDLLSKCKKLKKQASIAEQASKNYENLDVKSNSATSFSTLDSGVCEEYEAEILSLKSELEQVKQKLKTSKSENFELQESLAKARNNKIIACAVLPKSKTPEESLQTSKKFNKKQKKLSRNHNNENKKAVDYNMETSNRIAIEKRHLEKELAIFEQDKKTWEAMIRGFKAENDKLKKLREDDVRQITGLHSKLEASRRAVAALMKSKIKK